MADTRGDVLALVGAQYGSEGKGVIAAHLAHRYDVHVRTGGPNAGHSFYHPDTDAIYAMQALPCGWINPAARLVIGAGALVDVAQLSQEIDEIVALHPDAYERIFIDAKAGVISARHQKEEGGIEGEMHRRIGSTGKGVGAARGDRMNRDPAFFHTMEQVEHDLPAFMRDRLCDTVPFITDEIQEGYSVLLEGTQGSGLSLIHGPWPYVTSHDTNAATLAADAGVPPHWITQCVLVARTYPIRVAGNSGPLRHESTWDEMSEHIGKDVIEYTTVTKKPRRIGAWDPDLVERAVMLNAPTSFAITFLDYLDPKNEGAKSLSGLTEETHDFLGYLRMRYDTPVSLVATGGTPVSVIDTGYAI